MNKGTHRALDRFRSYAHEVSKNHTCTCWVLKCDVRKFFASIDHAILKRILASYIHDRDVRILLENIIHSFHATSGVGLPLGNLTSQLFANVYLNEFDQFVKHQLKAAHYIRYCDDFVLLSANKTWLETCIPRIHRFMNERLRLTLHPPKVSITTVASGVDFLGWVHFSDHRIPRTTTKRRMLARMTEYPESATYTSYAGLLKHGNTQKLHNELTRRYICNQGDS